MQDQSQAAEWQKKFFPHAKFTRKVFCSFLSTPMCGKPRKHLFNTDVIVDSTISHAWMLHAIFLSDRNNLLWECWYNLANLTNQRVYQELVYRNGLFKEMITGSTTPSHPSFLTFYFCVRVFSIHRARISQSLDQAISHQTDNLTFNIGLHVVDVWTVDQAYFTS